VKTRYGCASFSPEFTHQVVSSTSDDQVCLMILISFFLQFTQTIYGYKGLKIELFYSPAGTERYLRVDWEEKLPGFDEFFNSHLINITQLPALLTYLDSFQDFSDPDAPHALLWINLKMYHLNIYFLIFTIFIPFEHSYAI
jgi:hypothetical protein